MVAVVAVHNLSEPRIDSGNRLVHAEAQFCLKCVQLRHHALLRRFPPHGERSVAPAPPAEVRETQERKGLRLSFTTLLAISGSEPADRKGSTQVWRKSMCSYL
jgi:hypothetical protein